MKIRKAVVAAATAVTMVVAPAVALAPSAQATPVSLAEVLAADAKKNGKPSFDKNKKDFDILYGAVTTVLAAKPDSAVALLADPTARLTAFIPNDKAFARTAGELGIEAKNEKRLLNKLARTLGVDGVEDVLLYHVVPGKKLTSKKVAKADGASLMMANGGTVKVNIRDNGNIKLRATGPATNPRVIAVDVNKKKGNKQVAHVINKVLLP